VKCAINLPLSFVRHDLGVDRVPGLAVSKIFRRPPGRAPAGDQLAEYTPAGLAGDAESPVPPTTTICSLIPNLPLRLYLAELSSPYPDVNQSLIQFFQTHAQPGDTILTTYGDLPSSFILPASLRGLQGQIPITRPLTGWSCGGILVGIETMT